MIVDTEQLPEVITPELQKAMQGALKEMSNSMFRTESEKDLQKDITQRMKDEYDIPKRDFTRLAKIYHASNIAEEERKNESFINFARAVLNTDNALTHQGE